MDERVLKWLKANVGKVFVSPRNGLSKRKPYDLRLLDVIDDKVKVHFEGSKYRALPLHFWMFDRTLEYLHKNFGGSVRLGSKVEPPYEPDTIEEQIWKHPFPTGNAPYKAAPHVCDILVLAGLAKYVPILKTGTRRRLQGVKLLDTKQKLNSRLG